MAVKLSIFNNKGGAGKTTTAATVAAILGQRGYKVLIVDLDQQANTTMTFGVADSHEPNIGSVFFEDMSVNDVMVKTRSSNVTLLPSGNSFAGAATRLVLDEDGAPKEFRLKIALEECEDQFDYIIIDCPPEINVLIRNAIIASTDIIIPVYPSKFSMDGLKRIMRVISKLKRYMNYNSYGILINRFESKLIVHKANVEIIKKNPNLNVYNTIIRKSVAVIESESLQTTVNYHSPNSQAAIDYKNFVDELIETCER